MSATPSSRASYPPARINYLLTVGWAVSAVANIVLMYLLPGRETIPFHLVWIGLGIIYGFTRWSTIAMVAALGGVTMTTAWVLGHHAEAGEIGWEEVSEVPLMAALFGALVWHVHRRQQMLAEVQRMAAVEHRRLEAQQLFVRLSSHELRTPITVARGYTELVRAANPDPRTLEDTGIVLEELDKLSGITQRLVTLMQMGEPSKLELIDIDAELARVVRRWQPTATRQWTVAASVGRMLADPERLETALDCLLENAVKFTAPGDLIAVIGRCDRDTWTVEVIDSGAGMDPDQAALLVDDCPASPTPTGTGLGLAIVRAAVLARDGRLSIRSTPGIGTTVSIQLPNCHRAPYADVEAPHGRPEPADLRSKAG